MAFQTSVKKATVKPSPFFYISTIILLGFLCYSNSLRGEFVYDDDFLISSNASIRQFDVIKIFSQDIVESHFERPFYRPVQSITYAIDHLFWGLKPLGYHLTNTFIHILNAILIYVLLCNFTSNKMVPYVSSLLFVCHPIHTQAVSYISGRADILLTFFFLLSFITLLEYRRSGASLFLVLSVIFYIFSLLSKEAAVIIPLVFISYEIIYRNEPATRVNKRIYAPFLMILATYSLIRFNHLLAMERFNIVGAVLSTRILTMSKATMVYLFSLIMPVGLHMRRSLPFSSSFFEIRTFSSSAVIIALICAAFFLRKNKKHISFFIFYFFLMLIPVSNLFQINAILAEHWLYMPSIAYFFIFAYFLYGLSMHFFKNSFKTAMVIAVFIFIMPYSFITIKQNTYWRDNESLYKHILYYEPFDAGSRLNLGLYYMRKGRFEDAIKEEKKVLALHPDAVYAYHCIAYIYYNWGKMDEAEKYFKIGLSTYPDDKSHNYLGKIYEMRDGNDLAAENEYRKAMDVNPHSARSYINLAGLRLKENNLDGALQILKKAIKLCGPNPYGHSLIAVIYGKKGDYPEAFKHIKKAMRLDPEDEDININMGNICNGLGRFDKAISHYKKVININPKRADAYYNMGNSYYFKGEIKRARNYWEKSLKINPDFEAAKEQLKKTKNE